MTFVRVLALAAAAAMSIAPVGAGATPSPSPSLDQVLAPPPSADFSELTTAPLRGQFNAHDWAAANATGSAVAETEATLAKDGFVTGFAQAWSQASSGHAMVEAVMAFSGGREAKSALASLQRSDRSRTGYQHEDTLSGIETYYGVHLDDPLTRVVADLFVFVKGNDVFFVLFASHQDDVLAPAREQAEKQFDDAPASTIPASLWPENAVAAGSSPGLGLGLVVGLVVVLAVIAAIRLRRRRVGPVPAMMSAGRAGGFTQAAPPERRPGG